MLATAVLEDAAAWLGVPVVFVSTGLGLGLLVERAAGLRLPAAAALLPLGTCTGMCIVLTVYKLGGHGGFAAGMLCLLAAAGFVVGRRDLLVRMRPGPAALGAVAVFLLYIAPTLLTGHWSWNGYNFLNDTAVQFVLADQLKQHGSELVHGAFSTHSEFVRVYMGSAYPLGPHAQVATLSALLGVGVDVVYQSYLAVLSLTSALALTVLARRSGLGPWSAAAAGSCALAANLIYQYGMQGSIKELGGFTALATAAMLGNELLTADRPVRFAVPLGIAAAAMLSALSTAAGPYLIVLGVGLAAAAWLSPAFVDARGLAKAAAVSVCVAVIAALPTMASSLTFLQVSKQALAADTATTSALGQLGRPLELIQVAGVWLSEDYSFPVVGATRSALTQGLTVLVLVLAVAGAATFLRRRVPGPVPLLLSTVVSAAALASRASPYADAKLLALASPAVLFTALCGALAWRRRWRLPGIAAAGVMAAAALASAAFAYHGTRLAPVARLQALEDAVDHIPGRGWILLDEIEEFGKYYGRAAPHFTVAFEAITPRRAAVTDYHLDLDQLPQAYVQSFDAIVTRVGPATSRPPANYRRIYVNRWYQVWARRRGIRVVQHMAVQGALDAGGTPSCKDIRAFARTARPGDRLVAAPSPETVQLSVVDAPDRPAGWPPLALPPGVVGPATPGVVEGRVRVRGGAYDAWVRASTGRRLTVSVDGRVVGAVKQLNTQGQWLPAGSVQLASGRHELKLARPGGGLAPGDAVKSVIGPVALVRREPRALRTLAPRNAPALCGKRWDWLELVSR